MREILKFKEWLLKDSGENLKTGEEILKFYHKNLTPTYSINQVCIIYEDSKWWFCTLFNYVEITAVAHIKVLNKELLKQKRLG